MQSHAAYFDAILFGKLLLASMVLVGCDSPTHLVQLVRLITGLTVGPGVVENILGGADTDSCSVPVFRAIVETLEPPGGSAWFDPAFRPETACEVRGRVA